MSDERTHTAAYHGNGYTVRMETTSEAIPWPNDDQVPAYVTRKRRVVAKRIILEIQAMNHGEEARIYRELAGSFEKMAATAEQIAARRTEEAGDE